jgi:hypothetical protein
VNRLAGRSERRAHPGPPADLPCNREPRGRWNLSKRDPLSEIEQILRDHSALRGVKQLLACNCDRVSLLLAANMLRSPFADDSWEHALGPTKLKVAGGDRLRKNVQGLVRRIQKLSDEVNRLNATPLGWKLANYPVSNRRFYQIPDLLIDYGNQLKAQIAASGPKKHPSLNAAKAMLVAYVLDVTGKPHDEEVAVMIEAMVGGCYSTETHKMWRRNHSKLVKRARNSR